MFGNDESDEDILDLVVLSNLNRCRKFRDHSLRFKKGSRQTFDVTRELEMSSDRFDNFYSMSKECFYRVLALVRNSLTKNNTNMREPVGPEERLLITLRYFAIGYSFKELSNYFVKEHSTIRKIVHDTSQVIWEKLQPVYMPTPSREKWIEISRRYYDLWNLPHCVGSIDGMQIKIKPPPRSGSVFINYEGYFSIVLLAVADADGAFVTVDVGELGRISDGRPFQNSTIRQALQRGHLDLPEPIALPEEKRKMPYFFVADESYSLSKNLMKPFSRKQLNNDERKIFNSRLMRGRKSVECAFGMLTSKFQILSTPICCDPAKADRIVQAICVLHNAIKECDGIYRRPQYENVIIGNRIDQRTLPTGSAKNVRDYLSNYFKDRSPIPKQNRYC